MNDYNELIGKQFQYKSKYGLSEWIGTIKEIHPLTIIRPYRMYWIRSNNGIVYQNYEIEIVPSKASSKECNLSD